MLQFLFGALRVKTRTKKASLEKNDIGTILTGKD